MDALRKEPTGPPTSAYGFSEPESVPDSLLPNMWVANRLPDGDIRLQPGYTDVLRGIAVSVLIAAAGPIVIAAIRDRDLITFLVSLAAITLFMLPLLAPFTRFEEWRIGHTRLDLITGYLGIHRTRRFSGGTFVVTLRRPASKWKPLTMGLVGASLMYGGYSLFGLVRLGPSHRMPVHIPDEHLAHVFILCVVLSIALMLYGGGVLLWMVFGWFYDRSHRDACHTQLLLRRGARETVLISCDFKNHAGKLNSFAAWLGRETGFTVEPHA